jgi:hypothetical protein
LFQSGQEGVVDEGIASVVQGVPVGGGDVGKAMEEAWIRHGERIGQGDGEWGYLGCVNALGWSD